MFYFVYTSNKQRYKERIKYISVTQGYLPIKNKKIHGQNHSFLTHVRTNIHHYY